MNNISVKAFIKSNFPIKKFVRGQILFYEGAEIEYIPYVLEGELKIYLISDSGREILLYKVLPDQFCLFALLSFFSHKTYPAYTFVEKNSKIICVNPDYIRNLIEKELFWKNFFINEVSECFLSIVQLINHMTSSKVLIRLIDYLRNYNSDLLIEKTHEEIAKDLGTSRVVISRLLKFLEKQGTLRLMRRKILIVDQNKLEEAKEDFGPPLN